MLIRFKDNLGSRDAQSLGVDFRECTKGAEIDVPDDQAKRIVDGGFAVVVEPAASAVKLHGVPSEPTLRRKKPDVQADDSSKSVEPEAVPKGEKKPSA